LSSGRELVAWSSVTCPVMFNIFMSQSQIPSPSSVLFQALAPNPKARMALPVSSLYHPAPLLVTALHLSGPPLALRPVALRVLLSPSLSCPSSDHQARVILPVFVAMLGMISLVFPACLSHHRRRVKSSGIQLRPSRTSVEVSKASTFDVGDLRRRHPR
jgi:hypothetical protein